MNNEKLVLAVKNPTFKIKFPKSWWEIIGYVLLLVTAGVMRLWDLGTRDVHHDESLHSFYSWVLSQGDGYQHMPMTHGPFQFNANAAIFTILGDGDYTSRLLYALFGTVLVLVPCLLKSRLGSLGALVTGFLLALSPTMLYFSRFARNDILMAMWTFGLVVCMWRYIDEGKHRYLYFGAALLGFAFATKETAYLNTAILGLFLALMLVPRFWKEVIEKIHISEVSPPIAIIRIFIGVLGLCRSRIKLSEVSRPAAFLIFIMTLTLPLWSAFVSVLQETFLLSWSNIVLASPEEGTGQTGFPSSFGIVIARVVVIVFLGVSLLLGSRWNWSVWWRSSLIFYGIWTILYTSFFTNGLMPIGSGQFEEWWNATWGSIGSGIWGSLGYWIAQQDVARGNQPWYYFLVISSIYEFVPLFFAFIATIYYMRRKDLFGQFLIFWTASTLVFHTVASEKMPWLLVGVTLPMIVLCGKFLSDVVRSINWNRLIPSGRILLVAGVPLFLYLLWQIAFYDPETSKMSNVLILMSLCGSAIVLFVIGVYLFSKNEYGDFAPIITIPFTIIMLFLSIQTAVRASYENGDIPVEMIVYTQTSPDIPKLMNEINKARQDVTPKTDLSVTIDSTSGFTWPWAWYLRDYPKVSYIQYETSSLPEVPDADVVLLHATNHANVGPVLREHFTEGERIKHRWWFPEDTYRGMTIGKFLYGLTDRATWGKSMDYFLYREGVRDRVGSEDVYIYFDPSLDVYFSTTD